MAAIQHLEIAVDDVDQDTTARPINSHAAYAAETAEIPPIPAGNIRGPRLTLRANRRHCVAEPRAT